MRGTDQADALSRKPDDTLYEPQVNPRIGLNYQKHVHRLQNTTPGKPYREDSSVLGEVEYWKSLLGGIVKPRVSILPYIPEHRQPPARVLPVITAWKGIESVLADLIARFGIGNSRCLEFGVEHGYSTAALSCFFESVTGVDTFIGDIHTRDPRDLYSETSARLSDFDNIQLIRSDYRDWIAKDNSSYDLIHIDIVHTYVDTFACGSWSAKHSQCVLFHDTESFPAVKRAVLDISRESGKTFYNFTESCGLGILA